MAFPWLRVCKKPIFVMMATILLFSTGCWDRIEVNDLAIIRIAGLDRKENGEIELSLEIVAPKRGEKKSQKSESAPTLIWSASGATAADAASKLQLKLSRSVYWGQLELLVFGETLAREKFLEQIDFLVRDNSIRLRVQPFVCKGPVSSFLASVNPLEQTKADFLGGEAERLFRKPITLNRLVQKLGKKSETAMLPYMDTTQDGNESIPYVKGYAVFSSDHMAGVIQGKAFSGVRFIFKQVNGDVETVKLEAPSNPLVSLKVLSSNAQLVPRIEGEMPRMTVGIKVNVSVLQNTSRFESSDPIFIRQTEKAAVDVIRYKVEKSIKQAQGMGVDIFGFGEAFYRQYPREWQRLQEDRWESIFPSMQVKVNVEVRILHTGMNNEPAGQS